QPTCVSNLLSRLPCTARWDSASAAGAGRWFERGGLASRDTGVAGGSLRLGGAIRHCPSGGCSEYEGPLEVPGTTFSPPPMGLRGPRPLSPSCCSWLSLFAKCPFPTYYPQG